MHKSNYISKLFVIILMIFYSLDLFTKGQLTQLFAFDSRAIVDSGEFWRLVTYIFVPGQIEGIVLGFVTFLALGTRLELSINKFVLPILLILVASMHSTFFIWLNTYSDISFSGIEGLAFFVITIFVFINWKDRTAILGKKRVYTRNFAFALGSFWSIIQVLKIIEFGDINATSSMFFAGFGIINGLILNLQLFVINKISQSRISDNPEYEKNEGSFLSEMEKEEFSLALIASKEKYLNHKEEKPLLSNDPQFNENKMNEILDKISEHGFEALSPNEEYFLKEYSKSIN